jgi:hypothetical protein
MSDFVRTPGICDQLKPGFSDIPNLLWLRGPLETCIASTPTLAHAILGIYFWLGRPTRDFVQWNAGTTAPTTLNQMLTDVNIPTCYTQHCEHGYAIAFDSRFPVETNDVYVLNSPYQLMVYDSSVDINKSHWGRIGAFYFTSSICLDPTWPASA